MQVNEMGNKTEKEDDLQERENVMGKNQFLSWVGAKDCIKDKLTGKYAIQLMGIDALETKPSQTKANHYKFMEQKVKKRTPTTQMTYSKIVKQNGTKKRTLKKN